MKDKLNGKIALLGGVVILKVATIGISLYSFARMCSSYNDGNVNNMIFFGFLTLIFANVSK